MSAVRTEVLIILVSGLSAPANSCARLGTVSRAPAHRVPDHQRHGGREAREQKAPRVESAHCRSADRAVEPAADSRRDGRQPDADPRIVTAQLDDLAGNEPND